MQGDPWQVRSQGSRRKLGEGLREGAGGLAWKHREWGYCCDLTQTRLVTCRASMGP